MLEDKSMDKDTSYLTLEQILVIHEDQIDRYGGSHGLRDLALLESAIFRPQTTFSGAELYPTLFDKVAALLHLLVLNHPFIDGNKRTAITSSIVFLLHNGYELRVSNNELVDFVLRVENKKYSVENISKWLKNNSNPISS